MAVADKKIPVSKVDAARRQLETAINLFFFYGDPVSIHALASASFQVLADIAKNRGADIQHFHSTFMDRVKPEYRKEVSEKIRAPGNFFKHADRDPDSHYDLNPQVSEFMLLDAVILYHGLTSEFPPIMRVYNVWWLCVNRHLIKDKSSAEYHAAVESAGMVDNRTAFYKTMLPVFLAMWSGTPS